jgi:hypothetical protein
VKREDCRWLSATNADNIYGSGIVKNVRNVLFQPEPDERSPPDMILTPLDSRNFPEQGKRLLCAFLIRFFLYFLFVLCISPDSFLPSFFLYSSFILPFD